MRSKFTRRRLARWARHGHSRWTADDLAASRRRISRRKPAAGDPADGQKDQATQTVAPLLRIAKHWTFFTVHGIYSLRLRLFSAAASARAREPRSKTPGRTKRRRARNRQLELDVSVSAASYGFTSVRLLGFSTAPSPDSADFFAQWPALQFELMCAR